ncbi:MAG: response regulator [Pseudomonadota bacterium]
MTDGAAVKETSPEAPNLSTILAPYLPYLRRFARALCGTQTAGDAYVAQTLEAIIEDRDVINHDLPPRVALYRLFHSIWAAGNISDDKPTTSPSRRMLLLVAVEEFTEEEAAQVMDVDADEAAILRADGQTELDRQRNARVLIIEDEPIIAMDLESIVSGMGHVVVGMADTHTEAVAKAESSNPDLILADIQLADGSSGVEAVDEIMETAAKPVIFITAYPERLLTGDRVEPPFLITKPFRPEAIEAAIAQALFHNPR